FVRKERQERLVEASDLVVALEDVEERGVELEVAAPPERPSLLLTLELHRREEHGGLRIAALVRRGPASEAVREVHRFEATLLEVLLGLALDFDQSPRRAQLLSRELGWILADDLGRTLKLLAGHETGQERRAAGEHVEQR